MKHTPGPWSVETHFKILTDDTGKETRLPYYEVGSDLRRIATVNTGMNDSANACLIAAAPEMLSALKFIETLILMGRPIIDADLVSIQTIITKATK